MANNLKRMLLLIERLSLLVILSLITNKTNHQLTDHQSSSSSKRSVHSTKLDQINNI